MNLCSHCGHENSEAAHFCVRCGKPLSGKNSSSRRNQNPYEPGQGRNYAYQGGDNPVSEHPLPPPPPPQEPPYPGGRDLYRDGSGLEDLEDDARQRKTFHTVIMALLTVLVVAALGISAFVVTRSLTDGGSGDDKKAASEKTRKNTGDKGEETTDLSDRTQADNSGGDYDEVDMSDLGEDEDPGADQDGFDDSGDGDIDDSAEADEELYADFIFPDSHERYLSESEVSSLSNEDLRMAINEIYAREGYDFKNKDIKKHFEKYDWYEPVYKNQPDVPFNQYEKKNVDLLAEYREK